MTLSLVDLSAAEIAALQWIKTSSCNLVSKIPETTSTDVFGTPIPGLAIFRKLVKKGLAFETEEDPVHFDTTPDEEPFFFTPSIELTEQGEHLANLIGR